jgi:carbamoyl-phosphate synthase large subunit
MTNILVTGVGGPTPRSFVKAVKLSDNKAVKNYKFIGVDCNPLAYGLYDKGLFEKTFVVPLAAESGYWERINELVEREKIDGAVILPEVEVLEWAENHSKLKKKIQLHLPDFRLASALVNKHRLQEFLEGTGLVPEYGRVDPKSMDYESLANSIGVPFWIRSSEGSSGLGSLKIESEGSLSQWISINSGVTEFIASEFLPGRNMACKMLYFDDKLVRTACAERVEYIMAKVAPSGITGNTSFGRLINEPELVQLSEKALKLISSELGTGLNGIFTVDYKEDAEGNPKITEINIRHVAFTSSIAAGGANIPMDTLHQLFIGDLKPERIDYEYEEGLIFLRDVDVEPILMRKEDLFSHN